MRTDEPFFVEEEKEKRLDSLFEADIEVRTGRAVLHMGRVHEQTSCMGACAPAIWQCNFSLWWLTQQQIVLRTCARHSPGGLVWSSCWLFPAAGTGPVAIRGRTGRSRMVPWQSSSTHKESSDMGGETCWLAGGQGHGMPVTGQPAAAGLRQSHVLACSPDMGHPMGELEFVSLPVTAGPAGGHRCGRSRTAAAGVVRDWH